MSSPLFFHAYLFMPACRLILMSLFRLFSPLLFHFFVFSLAADIISDDFFQLILLFSSPLAIFTLAIFMLATFIFHASLITLFDGFAAYADTSFSFFFHFSPLFTCFHFLLSVFFHVIAAILPFSLLMPRYLLPLITMFRVFFFSLALMFFRYA